MRTVVRLEEKNLAEFVDIVATSFTAKELFTDANKRTYLQQLQWEMADPTVGFYGLYEDGHLLGGMKFYDFQMKLLSTTTLAGGVGLVATSLTNKKQGVCKDMITFFLEHYRKKGAPIALLHAFRPDFYRKMGFGFGVKNNQYRVKSE